MRVTAYDDPRAFRDAVTPFLLADEAQHNLILGLVTTLCDGRAYGPEPPVLLAVTDGAEVLGAAVMTPPYKLVVTDLPETAVASVAEQVGGKTPGLLGSPRAVNALAAAFGGAWSRERREGIYRLSQVTMPDAAPGTPRPATLDDEPLVSAWLNAFGAEVGLPIDAALARQRLEAGLVHLWVDGPVMSLAGQGALTPHGVRIGPVYTPPESRGRGYASNLVAHLSQQMLDRGRDYCFLYTDLDNPTSNHVYLTIGYEFVTEHLTLRREPAAPG
jgi:uncharacterized protein